MLKIDKKKLIKTLWGYTWKILAVSSIIWLIFAYFAYRY